MVGLESDRMVKLDGGVKWKSDQILNTKWLFCYL